jgi:hypothetical protein
MGRVCDSTSERMTEALRLPVERRLWTRPIVREPEELAEANGGCGVLDAA